MNKISIRTSETHTAITIMMLVCFLGLLCLPTAHPLTVAGSEPTPQFDDSNFQQGYDKRLLDPLAGEIIRKNSEKRFLDSLASDIIKRNTDKRFLDSLASDIIKRESETRYFHAPTADLMRQNTDKRFLDPLATDIITKRENVPKLPEIFITLPNEFFRNEDLNTDASFGQSSYYKDVLDSAENDLYYSKVMPHANNVFSHSRPRTNTKYKFNDSFLQNGGESTKRFLDPIASSLLQKRYLDGIASSLIKKEDGEKRYLDGIASSLIKKDDGEKRYLDGIASSLIKKDDGEKRYLDGIASSLIKKDDGEKRYLDGIASSLIKKDDGEKRYLDGIASSLIKRSSKTTKASVGTQSSHLSSKRVFEVTDDLMDGSKEGHHEGHMQHLGSKTRRRRRDVSIIPLTQPRKHLTSRRRRFIDSLASEVIYKRRASPEVPQNSMDRLIPDKSNSNIPRLTSNKLAAALPNKPLLPPFYFSTNNVGDDIEAAGDGRSLRYPSRFKIVSQLPEEVDLEALPKSSLPGTFWTLNKVDPIFRAPLPHHLLMDVVKPLPYGQIVYPFKPAQLRAAFHRPGLTDPHHQDDGGAPEDPEDGDAPEDPEDGEINEGKRFSDNAYLDEVAAELFNDRRVFKKKYLDDVASSLLHKRYLDGLATSIIKRYDNEDFGGYSGRLDTFKTSATTPLRKFTPQRGNPLSKRFIDSLASELLYKRATGGMRAESQDTDTDTYYL